MTRLSSHFLAVVENKLISEKFNIENYRDFTDNPYKFELPARVVNVTDAPFNAKGDHFTDDTDAIQAAIDYISSQGGGRVVIPGDTTTPEGRRYVVTCIKLKSNVELHIEKEPLCGSHKMKTTTSTRLHTVMMCPSQESTGHMQDFATTTH